MDILRLFGEDYTSLISFDQFRENFELKLKKRTILYICESFWKFTIFLWLTWEFMRDFQAMWVELIFLLWWQNVFGNCAMGIFLAYFQLNQNIKTMNFLHTSHLHLLNSFIYSLPLHAFFFSQNSLNFPNFPFPQHPLHHPQNLFFTVHL